MVFVVTKMTNQYLIHHFNATYEEDGFCGVLKEVKDMLRYGNVTKIEDGLYRVSTGGWSDDEDILHNLTHILSVFGHRHYVGYLRGGAFYFSEKEHDLDIEIVRLKE